MAAQLDAAAHEVHSTRIKDDEEEEVEAEVVATAAA